MSNKRDPLLSDAERAEMAHRRTCQAHGDPRSSGAEWMAYFKAHGSGSSDAREFYESARHNDANMIQLLVDAMSHTVCFCDETPCVQEIAMKACNEAGFTPTE